MARRIALCFLAGAVMAVIAMNSGLITKASVMHRVTSRSTGDDVVTEEHLTVLEAEAVRLYTGSKFKVTPAPGAALRGRPGGV